MVAGSGHGGRVTREDVMKFVESGGAAAAAKAAPAKSAQSAISAPPAPSPVAQGDSLKQASPMRKAIAAQMTKALAIPVAYTVVEVDMSGVVALRDAAKGSYATREGIGLTFDAIVAKATVEALKLHADLNGHYTDEGHWRRAGEHRIAVAVMTARRAGHDAVASASGLKPDPRPGRQSTRRQAQPRRHKRRHVHARQHRLDRVAHHPADHQRAAGGHPDDGVDRQAPRRRSHGADHRCDRSQADDVHVPGLRPPRHGRRAGRPLHH
jgi:hypothetical protein